MTMLNYIGTLEVYDKVIKTFKKYRDIINDHPHCVKCYNDALEQKGKMS